MTATTTELCPVSGWSAEQCECKYGAHEKFANMENEIKKLRERLEDAESVIHRYAQTVNWFTSDHVLDDEPEGVVHYQDVWNFDSEHGYEHAQTYQNAYREVSI